MGHSKFVSGFAAAVVLGVAVAGPAVAAEGASAADWAGFYVGLSAGPQFDSSKWTATSVGPNNVFGVDPSNPQATLDSSWANLGGYAGWNMQVAPTMIAGIEGDIAGIAGSSKKVNGIPGIGYGTVTPADSVSVSQDFDAAIRARFGVVVDPRLLAYGTAGVAFRNADYKVNCPSNSLASWCGVPEQGSISKLSVGWTVGAGVEGKLNDNFSVRVDYRYADYGSQNLAFFSAANGGADSVGGKIDLSSHIVTIGLTYRFKTL